MMLSCIGKDGGTSFVIGKAVPPLSASRKPGPLAIVHCGMQELFFEDMRWAPLVFMLPLCVIWLP